MVKRPHRTIAKRPEQQPQLQPQPSATIVRQQHWTGPLPPPAALAEFGQLIPYGAERIMAMVEQEQAHRIQHEDTILAATIADTRRGHWLGGAISLCAIVGAVYAVSIGAHPTVSIALVSLPIAAIVQSFIGKKVQ